MSASSESNWSPDWTTGPLAAGLACYRGAEYWAAHEHWETVWLTLQEPDKTFLRALIQLTASFHHISTGNSIGAASLLRKSLKKLERYAGNFGGIDVPSLCAEIAARLRAIDSGILPASTPPQIRPIHPHTR